MTEEWSHKIISLINTMNELSEYSNPKSQKNNVISLGGIWNKGDKGRTQWRQFASIKWKMLNVSNRCTY